MARRNWNSVDLVNKGIISQSELAEMFSASPSAIQGIHDRRTWKHITGKAA